MLTNTKPRFNGQEFFKKKLLLLLFVLLFVICLPVANADVITYSDRTAFRNATTGNVVIDFEGLLPDGAAQAVAGQTLTLSGATFERVSGLLALAGAGFYDDTSVLTAQNSSLPIGDAMTIALPGARFAIAVDLSNNQTGHVSDFLFELSNGDVSMISGGVESTFFGLITTTPFDSLTVSSVRVSDSILQVDNFEFGFAATASVPEPSPIDLLLVLSGGMFLAGRRRLQGASIE